MPKMWNMVLWRMSIIERGEAMQLEQNNYISDLSQLFLLQYFSALSNYPLKKYEAKFELFDPFGFEKANLNVRRSGELFNDISKYAEAVAKYGLRTKQKTHAYLERFINWFDLAKTNKNLWKRFNIALQELGNPFAPETKEENWNWGIFEQ